MNQCEPTDLFTIQLNFWYSILCFVAWKLQPDFSAFSNIYFLVCINSSKYVWFLHDLYTFTFKTLWVAI